MPYQIKVADTDLPVDVERNDDGTFTFTIEDRTYHVDAFRMSSNHLTASINGSRHHFHTHSSAGDAQIIHKGTSYQAEDAGKNKRKRSSSGPEAGDITPPMPGSIIRVLVAAGDEVSKGQELIVMSAMKMETTLYAPADGTIKAVLIEEGEQVAAGQQLVEFEATPQEAS
ncbi:MAG: hypothetical protein CL920_15480 [Deltaproteobacteria bacterium]|nr:hypothetical protein [Deltaproteobacteria bacterium]MBU50089.1 hypothetical protein [Deltaproteobacteria bacterium]|tara:strand:- start:4026 stop:4535 length:510 start_codon:yes stop_codon:yes gene_type:complete